MGLFSISWNKPDYAKRFRGRSDRINRFMAAQMQTLVGLRFDAEGAYNGHPKWKPPVFRDGKPLLDRGTLRKSLSPVKGKNSQSGATAGPGGYIKYSGNIIAIGTRLKYAPLMNYGGIVRPVNAEALAIPLPSGKRASDFARVARADSSSKKDLGFKISELQRQIATGGSTDKLQAKLKRYQEAMSRGPKNQRVIFRKKVTIPARQFNDLNYRDRNELRVSLKNLMNKIARGKI